MFPKRIIIFANGDLPDPDKAHALLRESDFIIAADGGTRHALALGLTPNIIIGDLDSLNVERYLQGRNCREFGRGVHRERRG
ncbi:MAG: hypothetical protein Q8K73_04185 [Anaerolineales bacterium]|nr:hypothetical protein [Anaerolineales bacterium]